MKMQDAVGKLIGLESLAEADDEAAPSGGSCVLPCFTNPAFEAERDPTKIPMYMPVEGRWLAALLDAIGSPVFPHSSRTASAWHTSWGQDSKEDNPPEHAAYLAYAKAVVRDRMPWLLSLLDGARALVVVEPGTFAFLVDNYQGITFDIPELTPYTYLLPWATDDDRKARH